MVTYLGDLCCNKVSVTIRRSIFVIRVLESTLVIDASTEAESGHQGVKASVAHVA